MPRASAPSVPLAVQRCLPWLCLLGVAAARLLALDADPPVTMPDATVMDEGLWADAARGKVLFGDWFADDLGNSRLIAPFYSHLLVLVYRLAGVGLVQTRLLAAVASIATAGIMGLWVGRRLGRGAAAFAIALLGLCPLLDQHGRFALLESTQAFWICLTFVLLFPRRPRTWTAIGAGLAMAAAVGTKPNAVLFGVLPFACAWLCEWYERAGRDGETARRLRQAALVVAAGTAGVLAIYGPVWSAHWSAFRDTVVHEGGATSWTLGDHLLRLGIAFTRESLPDEHRLWSLVRHAGALTFAAWCAGVHRATGARSLVFANRTALWCWWLSALAIGETSFDHVSRRQVLFLTPMAAIAVAWWRERRAPAGELPPAPPIWGWLLLLLLPLLLAKPALSNFLAPHLPALGVPASEGTTTGVAGLLVLAAWLGTALLLGALRVSPQPWLLVARAGAAPLFLLLLASEVPRLGALPPHQDTMALASARLRPLVPAGETVLGLHATTLWFGESVHTVRRVLPGRERSAPRPNPDVAERLRPRFVLDYAAPALAELRDVTAHGFHSIARVGLLRERTGLCRFDLELWERDSGR